MAWVNYFFPIFTASEEKLQAHRPLVRERAQGVDAVGLDPQGVTDPGLQERDGNTERKEHH